MGKKESDAHTHSRIIKKAVLEVISGKCFTFFFAFCPFDGDVRIGVVCVRRLVFFSPFSRLLNFHRLNRDVEKVNVHLVAAASRAMPIDN